MDILTPGLRGLIRNARFLRLPMNTDFHLGRYAQMLEEWARDARRELSEEVVKRNPQCAYASAKAAYHYGRLSMLCYREHTRRQELAARR